MKEPPVGEALRYVYRETVGEPVPERLQSLIERLREQENKGKYGAAEARPCWEVGDWQITWTCRLWRAWKRFFPSFGPSP